ncbi:MAG TPA: DUF3515 family protein [Dermatophilaceae bacterium]|nr:DUF3515 family protein [Dermatophilaceae bacterium]
MPRGGRPRAGAGRVLVAAVAVATLGLAGLGWLTIVRARTPAVAVSLPAAADDPACQRLSAVWPVQVLGLPPRRVSVESPAVRAWGDPAIVAICGYPAPAPSTSGCLTVDGVDWVLQQRSDGVQATTYGRSPAMDVLVPTAYTTDQRVLPALSAVARTLPETGHRCS